jgi:small subunit ribosomal protein S20
MANHKSAEKRIKVTKARTIANDARRSRVRTFIKKAEAAIVRGNKDEATAAVRVMESEITRGVNKGVVHKNTAARKVSRMVKKLKAMA